MPYNMDDARAELKYQLLNSKEGKLDVNELLVFC